MSELTFEKLAEAVRVLGGRPSVVGFYSCGMFSSDRTFSFEGEDGEVYHVAHPDLWKRVTASMPCRTTTDVAGLWGVQIVDLDSNRREARRVFMAMATAMQADGE